MGHIRSIGAKEPLMSLLKYRDQIETFEFGAQFAIFSGFRLVLSAMDENETLCQLIGELRSSKIRRKEILDTVMALLTSERSDSQLAFDGSLASYVYCLWKADLVTGYSASMKVLETPNLWWSAKLALHVRKDYLAKQIARSLSLRSDYTEQIVYHLAGANYPSLGVTAEFSRIPDMSPNAEYIAGQNRVGHLFTERGYVKNVKLLPSLEQVGHTNISNPPKKFKLTTAVA